MLGQPLKFFVVFFVVVEPVSLIPLFTGLTTGATGEYKRRMALRAVSVAAAILVLFALGGASFLNLMGISLEAFRIFGGLLLFLLALEMVFARESGTRTSSNEAAESRRRADIAAGVCGAPESPGYFSSIAIGAGVTAARADEEALRWAPPCTRSSTKQTFAAVTSRPDSPTQSELFAPAVEASNTV